MRNDFTRFPDLDELLRILKREQKRDLPPEKENVHYPNFSLIQRMLSMLKIESQFFETEYSDKDLVDKNLPIVAQQLTDEVAAKLASTPLTEFHHSIFNEIYEYLSEEDVLESANIVFVFGSRSETRIAKAMEIMKYSNAHFLLISGNCPIYDVGKDRPEAERHAQYALSHNVDPRKVLVENTSISIPDNVRSSLNLLDQKRIPCHSFILVNSPYSQRRGWAHFKKYLPDTIKLIRINSATNDRFSKEKWFTNEEGIRVIVNEFVKMKIATTLNTA